MKKRDVAEAVREDAALICAIAAGGGVFSDDIVPGRWTRVYSHIFRAIGTAEKGSLSLAVLAYVKATDRGPWTAEQDGEAEALLRTGWSP